MTSSGEVISVLGAAHRLIRSNIIKLDTLLYNYTTHDALHTKKYTRHYIMHCLCTVCARYNVLYTTNPIYAPIHDLCPPESF